LGGSQDARGFGDHLHRVAGALLDAYGATGAKIEIDAVAVGRTELDDCGLRAGGEATVAFEAIATREAAVGFMESGRLAQPHCYLCEAHSLGRRDLALREGIASL